MKTGLRVARRTRLVAALGAALIAVSALGQTGPARAAGQAQSPGPLNLGLGWPNRPGLVMTPNAKVRGRSGELIGVFCTSKANCWAVGEQMTKLAELNQVLHWTGKNWVKITVPEPGGTGKDDVNQLNAVRCTSALNCWAVGDYAKNGAVLDQILHWTGKKWFVVTAPTPAGTLPGDVSELGDVACTSKASCWAVGSYGTDDSTASGERAKNQALFWNGNIWKLVPTPNPAGFKKNHGNALTSIRCSSPTGCWAAGAYGVLGKKFIVFDEMLRWTGKKWTQVPVPSPAGTTKGSISQIFGLACTSAKSCLAVGSAENFGPMGKALNIVLRWNGTTWAKVGVPNPDGSTPGSLNELGAVNCASPRDCWAVGSFGGASATSPAGLNQALHWTGGKWKVISTPNPAGTKQGDSNRLNSIRCTAPASCWTVGQTGHNGPNQDEALRWNGAKWLVD